MAIEIPESVVVSVMDEAGKSSIVKRFEKGVLDKVEDDVLPFVEHLLRIGKAKVVPDLAPAAPKPAAVDASPAAPAPVPDPAPAAPATQEK